MQPPPKTLATTAPAGLYQDTPAQNWLAKQEVPPSCLPATVIAEYWKGNEGQPLPTKEHHDLRVELVVILCGIRRLTLALGKSRLLT